MQVLAKGDQHPSKKTAVFNSLYPAARAGLCGSSSMQDATTRAALQPVYVLSRVLLLLAHTHHVIHDQIELTASACNISVAGSNMNQN